MIGGAVTVKVVVAESLLRAPFTPMGAVAPGLAVRGMAIEMAGAEAVPPKFPLPSVVPVFKVV
jgi:hypothetical protein